MYGTESLIIKTIDLIKRSWNKKTGTMRYVHCPAIDGQN